MFLATLFQISVLPSASSIVVSSNVDLPRSFHHVVVPARGYKSPYKPFLMSRGTGPGHEWSHAIVQESVSASDGQIECVMRFDSGGRLEDQIQTQAQYDTNGEIRRVVYTRGFEASSTRTWFWIDVDGKKKTKIIHMRGPSTSEDLEVPADTFIAARDVPNYTEISARSTLGHDMRKQGVLLDGFNPHIRAGVVMRSGVIGPGWIDLINPDPSPYRFHIFVDANLPGY